MDDNTGAMGDHAGQQSAIQSHGRKQVQGKFLVPCLVVKGGKPACRGQRPSQHMDDDVHTAELTVNSADDGFAARNGGQVCGNKDVLRKMFRLHAGNREYVGPVLAK